MCVCVCVCVCGERERERKHPTSWWVPKRWQVSFQAAPGEPPPHIKHTCWCCKGRSFLSHLKGSLLPSLILRVHKNEWERIKVKSKDRDGLRGFTPKTFLSKCLSLWAQWSLACGMCHWASPTTPSPAWWGSGKGQLSEASFRATLRDLGKEIGLPHYTGWKTQVPGPKCW